MESSGHANGGDPSNWRSETIKELLKRKRKLRGVKACFPCRHRKVRCDGNAPCSTCVRRSHPELCRIYPTVEGASTPESTGATVYNPALAEPKADLGYRNDSSRQGTPGQFNHASPVSSSSGPRRFATVEGLDATIQQLERIESDISSLKAELIQRRETERLSIGPISASGRFANRVARQSTSGKPPGTHFVEASTGATIYLGSQSDPPLALGCRRVGEGVLDGSLIDQEAIPRTYPFTDLWRPVVRAEEICETLPGDSDILRYWQTYQTYVYPFYPALVTLEWFNIALFQFLDRRRTIPSGDSSFDELDPSWLALLFAILALGVQFSEDPISERDLRSKVFICSSFQFLRISNILNHADLNQIQAMALIGHFLRNNQETNSAWVLMGTTVRLAQSIGLHEEALSTGTSTLPPAEQFQRKRFWWMLTWQDTFLSFTYDRPPMTTNPRCPVPLAAKDQGYSFAECVFILCQIIQERAQQLASTDMSPQDYYSTTMSYKQRFEKIFDVAAPFLNERTACRTLKDHLERLALHIHAGYGICRLLRFALGNISDGVSGSDAVKEMMSHECASRAAEVVESFLDMYRFSVAVCRSWAFVHNAVSCAIKFKAVGGMTLLPAGEPLMRRLIVVLEKETKLSEWSDADGNERQYGPFSRALKALTETYAERDDGHVPEY